jgi:hypothetical protein
MEYSVLECGVDEECDVERKWPVQVSSLNRRFMRVRRITAEAPAIPQALSPICKEMSRRLNGLGLVPARGTALSIPYVFYESLLSMTISIVYTSLVHTQDFNEAQREA